MKSKINYFLLLALLLLFNTLITKAQYGYSPLVDSLMQQITDSSLSILNRQLSGDTSVIINGITDTLKSRHSLNPYNAKAAQFILQKFQSYGLNTYIQQYDPDGQNVIAILPGTVYPQQQFLITAHYDDMPYGDVAPGADDNASGVCAVLEAARVLSGCSFPYTIRFIAFDEEEQGLIGSQAYADSAYLMGHQIAGMINLDMISWDSNGDNDFLVSTNSSSVPLMMNYIDLLKLYQPTLSSGILYNIGASDHWRFWGKGFTAIMAIEEYQGDFNAYYHTVNDHYIHINHAYFLAMARGAIAALGTMASHYTMNLAHVPLGNDLSTDPQVASLVVSGQNMPDTLVYPPRLYYRVDEDTFNFVNPFNSRGDTMDFLIPGFPTGSKISYYFAVQDAAGMFTVTLPEFGKGSNPPGSTPPPDLYSYYVLRDTTVTTCATALPLSIPVNSNIIKTLNVPFSGRILDIDARINISHTNLKDLSIYLISPGGREIALSTRNGYNLDNYSNTVFDDEASGMIIQAIPPYNGNFRPEQPLWSFDDTTMYGDWSLRIKNTGNVAGSLLNFCLIITYSGGCHYVDAALPFSGDGLTWQTAFTSITEAYESGPLPGEVILIKPGYYQEVLTITSNGVEIVPLTTGVTVSNKTLVQFPPGTDLSGINLQDYPGQYYVYLYRSRNFNNGFFQVVGSDDENDNVRVQGVVFNDESGVSGESTKLSAAVGRPVIYRKYSLNPDAERVQLDSMPSTSSNPAVYIGDPIDGGELDALPANYNVLDGLDMSGALLTEGLHLQSSSFNVICNCRIFDTYEAGIYVNGNGEHPANYNMLIGNIIYNTNTDGVYIGSESLPEYNNHADFNQIIGNDFHTDGESSYAHMHNAIHVNDDNGNTLIERNFIHDLQLEEPGRGAIDVHSRTSNTILNGNVLKNIGSVNSGTYACIQVHEDNENVEIMNNVIFETTTGNNDVYAVWINGSDHIGSRMMNNTIYNTDRGLLLEDHTNPPDFLIWNNIFQVDEEYFHHLGVSGRFNLSHNLYFTNPEPENWMPYYNEPGRQIGPVEFRNADTNDFRITINSEKAICNGIQPSPSVLTDPNGVARDPQHPDIGAFELENKVVWLGDESPDWHNPQNWNGNMVPNVSSNVIIPQTPTYPVISGDNAVTGGVLLKSGSQLKISTGFQLHNGE